MTTPAKKIPDAQWEAHKTTIRTLYLDEDKTLDETMQSMNECHAFQATRAQFVRKLRNWGFDKNIKANDWHRALRSAEVEGKELVINGRPINAKRLKKRLGRSDFRLEDGRVRAASQSPSPPPPPARPAWDQMPDTPLLTAVRCRDLASVQGLLDFGAAVSLDPDSPHHRPFITAVNQGYTLILRALLAACRRRPESSSSDESVAAPDCQNRGYNALLRRAVNSLNLDSTKCLLDCGAEISSIQGMPCLEKMEESRRKKATQLIMALVENGADIDGFDESGGTETFLCTAIRCENFAMVSFLLRRGANPTRFPSSGMSSPLHLTMKVRDPIFGIEALEALVSHGADVDAYESVSNTHVPIGHDLTPELEAMLVDLIDGQRPGSYAFQATPVQTACLYSRERLLRALIDVGADVNVPPAVEGGFTALQITCLRGFTALFDILIEAGADINAPASSGFGFTALQAAMLGGHTELATRLLGLGADANAPPCEAVGLTALQAAAVTGNHQLTRRLLELGADVNAPAARELGRTPLQGAVHRGDTELVRTLLEAGANVSTPYTNDMEPRPEGIERGADLTNTTGRL